jgi:hypothetical protein
MAKKRTLFEERIEGVAAMKAEREGKITLRIYKVEARELSNGAPKASGAISGRVVCRSAIAV